MLTPRFRILFIEDNPADLLLFRFVLNANNVDNVDLQVVNRGDEALKLIRRVANGKAAAPHLVILDLNLPAIDGFEILKYFRSQPRFEGIPVIVMTGSASTKDREAAVALGVTDYLCKTSDLDGAIALGSVIKRRLASLSH